MAPRKPAPEASLPLAKAPARAIAHLRATDPRMGAIIDHVGPFHLPEKPADFFALCSAIMGQSISVKAAKTIVARFEDLAGGRDYATPAIILAEDADYWKERLRLSRAKAGALIGLAQVWEREAYTDAQLRATADADLIQTLTEVRGIGPWTVKMFLIFNLRRPDVFPQEDLGVVEGLRVLYDLPKRPTAREALAMAEPWAPWRTVATWYLWQGLMKSRDEDLNSGGGWW
ncbi:MAG: DNA-3-methyladenine glycosylase 2 family protein [Sumerlaeia bacterium]